MERMLITKLVRQGNRAPGSPRAVRRIVGHQVQLGRQAVGRSWPVGELLPKGHQHHRRVVGVGIEVVIVFEAPAARLGLDSFRPIAVTLDLLLQQPVNRPHNRRVVRAKAARRQRPQRDRGIPDRRLARLDSRAPRRLILD